MFNRHEVSQHCIRTCCYSTATLWGAAKDSPGSGSYGARQSSSGSSVSQFVLSALSVPLQFARKRSLRSDSDVDMVKRLETKNKSSECCTTFCVALCVASRDCPRQWEALDAATSLQTGRSEALGTAVLCAGAWGLFGCSVDGHSGRWIGTRSGCLARDWWC